MRHGDRFRWLDGGAAARARPVRDLLGYRVTDYYLITDEGLRELCGEYDMRAVLHALRNAGHLWHEADRLTRKSPKIEELGNSRPGVYWVEVKFLGEQQVYTEEDEAVSEGTSLPGAAPLSPGDDIPF